MAERPKYSSQKLTQKDRDILDKAIMTFVIKHYILIEKHPNPKEYANKVQKSLNSNKDLLALTTIDFIKNNPIGKPFEPKDLKKHITTELNNNCPVVTEDLHSQVNNLFNKPNPREVNEKILKKFIDEGILENFLGKNKFKKYYPPSRGRKSSSEQDEERRGKKSVYLVSEDIEQLKTTLKKPKSTEYLYKKLIKTGTIHKILKYSMTVFFHVLKLQESKIPLILKQSSLVLDNKLTKEDMDKMTLDLLKITKVL